MRHPGTKTMPFFFFFLQKYGHVAFDSTQKAVLTSCVLRYKPTLNSGPFYIARVPFFVTDLEL